MIPAANIFACIVTLFVSLILPIGLLIVYAVKNKGKGIWSAWLLGAAGFFVPQIVIRTPILTWLATKEGFVSFAQSHLLLYALLMAFTAGLFEMAGRLAAAKLMRKNLTCKRALAAGFGHGSIEAILIVGVTYIANLVLIAQIQTGGFDALIAQTAASGGDVSQLEATRATLAQTSWVLFLGAGLERLLTLVCQVVMSMLVCYGVHTGHTVKGILLCLGFHTLLDSIAGISMLSGTVLSQAAAYGIIYAILALLALLGLWILKTIRARWQQEEAYAAQ